MGNMILLTTVYCLGTIILLSGFKPVITKAVKQVDSKTLEVITTTTTVQTEKLDKAVLQTELDHIPEKIAELQKQIDSINERKAEIEALLKEFK